MMAVFRRTGSEHCGSKQTLHVSPRDRSVYNICKLTGQWSPYTKIWLRAMSTLFQARAKLSWSDADAFVPEITSAHKPGVQTLTAQRKQSFNSKSRKMWKQKQNLSQQEAEEESFISCYIIIVIFMWRVDTGGMLCYLWAELSGWTSQCPAVPLSPSWTLWSTHNTQHCDLNTVIYTHNTEHYDLHTQHCDLHTQQWFTHTTHNTVVCTLWSTHTTQRSAHCDLHTLHATLWSAHCDLHTPHTTLWSTHTT